MSTPAYRGHSEWRRIVVINALCALLAFAVSGEVFAPTWARRSKALAVSFVYANCIGTLAALVMPRVVARCARMAVTTRWTIRIAAIVCVTAAGIGAGATVLLVSGVIAPQEYVRRAIPLNWPAFALPMILAMFLVTSLYEEMRLQLEAASLALRTKERDEAVARQAMAEAQLAALESRVEPHFLFNALNSIAALIPDDPAGAELMVGQVASLLRSSLDDPAARLVPLEDEIRLVCDYLDIERARFGARLRYELQIAADVATTLVPRLSVQTLVENAVKYAVAPRRNGASLVIRASAGNGRARIEVIDDGPGFSPDEVTAGRGLALLRSRLAILFGERAALLIESRPGATSVGIELPWPHDPPGSGNPPAGRSSKP